MTGKQLHGPTSDTDQLGRINNQQLMNTIITVPMICTSKKNKN